MFGKWHRQERTSHCKSLTDQSVLIIRNVLFTFVIASPYGEKLKDINVVLFQFGHITSTVFVKNKIKCWSF